MKTLIAIMPYLLSAMSLFNIVTIWRARSTILQRDVRGHRKFMSLSLVLWATTLFLFALYLWLRGLIVLIAVPEAVFGLYTTLVILTLGMLCVSLFHNIKNCHAPYNSFTPKALLVWLFCCLLGILFFPLIDAHIIPV